MAVNLPPGCTARAPALTDAKAIAGFARSYTRSVAGIADYTVADVRDELTEPGFDPDRDARLVLDRGGQVVGYATASGESGSHQVEVDVLAPDPPVSRWLFAWAHDRARDRGREHGHPKVTLEHGVYRADKSLRAEIAAQGYHEVTSFHRMRIDHVGPTPLPDAPSGVVLRPVTEDVALRRVAHDVLNTSFADHFGFVPATYETWHDKLDDKSTFDWSQLWVAEVDGRAAGFLLCNDQYVDDEDCGYVSHIGVLPETRGRGIAKYLLRHAFATDAQAGRTGTILHVDSNNTTPALGLYQSVGMRPVLVIDVWCRTMDTGAAVCEP